MSETHLSRGIQDALEAMGAIVERVQAGLFKGAGGHYVRGAKPGTPDLHVAWRGGTGWLETKTKDGRLSKEQLEWHAAARAQGENIAVPRSIHEAVEAVKGWAK